MEKTIAFVLCVSLCCVESYRIFPLPGQSEAPLNPKFGLFNFKSASSSLVTVTAAPKLLSITPSRTTVAPPVPIPNSRLSSNIASSSRSEPTTSLNGSVQKFSSSFASTASTTTESQKIRSIATNFQKPVEHLATDLLPPKKVSVIPAPKPLPTSSHQTSGPSQVPSLASRLSSAPPKTPNAAVNRLSSNVAPQLFQSGPISNHVETLARDLLPPKEDVKTTVGRLSPVKQSLATDLLPPKVKTIGTS